MYSWQYACVRKERTHLLAPFDFATYWHDIWHDIAWLGRKTGKDHILEGNHLMALVMKDNGHYVAITSYVWSENGIKYSVARLLELYLNSCPHQWSFFQNINNFIFGYFEPTNNFFDNENKYFLGWPKRYFGYNGNIGPHAVQVKLTVSDVH